MHFESVVNGKYILYIFYLFIWYWKSSVENSFQLLDFEQQYSLNRKINDFKIPAERLFKINVVIYCENTFIKENKLSLF